MLSTTTTTSPSRARILILLSRTLLHPLPHHHPYHHPNHRPYSTPTPPSTPPPLLTTTDIPAPHTGHIRILTLSSPSNRNALSQALLSALTKSIQELHNETEAEWTQLLEHQRSSPASSNPTPNDPPPPPRIGHNTTRALILTSALPTTFSAGADLHERRALTPAQTSLFLTQLRSTLSLLSDLNIPTIAAVNGYALGGGLELALACHFRVVAETAVLGLPETRLGIIPGAGGTWRLSALVGKARARRWVLTGQRRGGREAVGEGVGDWLVELDEGGDAGDGERMRVKVLEASVGLARRICEGGPVAVGAALRAVKGAGEGEVGEAEAEMYEVVRQTRDRDEALLAFGEKRRAVFRGC